MGQTQIFPVVAFAVTGAPVFSSSATSWAGCPQSPRPTALGFARPPVLSRLASSRGIAVVAMAHEGGSLAGDVPRRWSGRQGAGREMGSDGDDWRPHPVGLQPLSTAEGTAAAAAAAPAAAAAAAVTSVPTRPQTSTTATATAAGATATTAEAAGAAAATPVSAPSRPRRRQPQQAVPCRSSRKAKPADKRRRRVAGKGGNTPPAWASRPPSTPPAPLSPDVVGSARAAAADSPPVDAWGHDADDDFIPASVLDCCVKLYVTHSVPNYSLPWQKLRQCSSTSSGFVVAAPEGADTDGPSRVILTNAHCVAHAVSVLVRKRGGDTKYAARVVSVGNECDLALLVVEDERFWGDDDADGEGDGEYRAGASVAGTRRPPAVKDGGGGGGRQRPDAVASGGLVFGPLPRLQDSVTVVGYPVGGENLAISAGVVSRIEMASYAHGNAELLTVQVDAPINAGNSGGPVFAENNTCVGVAFQSMSSADAEAVGWIIPSAVVHHFLVDYGRNGRYTGFPTAGFTWQRLESAAMRAAVGVGSATRGGANGVGAGVGVLVKRVDACGDVAQVLRRGDVLTAIDGVAVSSAGTVPFRPGERIHFSYLIASKMVGDPVTLSICRPVAAWGDAGDTAPAAEAAQPCANGEAVPAADSSASKARGVATASVANKATSAASSSRSPLILTSTSTVPPLPVPATTTTSLTVTYALPSMAAGRLVPVHDPRPVPPFLIVGGLVFFALTQPFLEAEFGEDWRLDAPVGLVYRAQFVGKAALEDQVVVLAQVLSHPLNRGYEHLNEGLPAALLSIDGLPVTNLHQAAAVLAAGGESAAAEYIRFDLEGDVTVVLERAAASARMGEVLDAHGIPRPRPGDDAGGLGVLHNWTEEEGEGRHGVPEGRGEDARTGVAAEAEAAASGEQQPSAV
ncbi:hypothetical protein MMPV_001844 [Pyropia vietnamensis]